MFGNSHTWSPEVATISFVLRLPGPPKEPEIMAQYLKIESIGSIGSIILAILEVQVCTYYNLLYAAPETLICWFPHPL